MKKMLIPTLVPVVLLGLLVVSASWFISTRNDRILQELTKACIDRGYNASSSTEDGLFRTQVTFHCVASSSSATRQ